LRGQRLELVGGADERQPVILATFSANSFGEAGFALRPVPTAVPPCASG
jgi:hypothetical protein